MASAVRSAPLPFLPAPARKTASPYPQDTVQTVRKFVHGVGSAMLVFTGAGAITNPAVGPAVADFSSLEGMFATLMQGDYAGLAQIAAAAFVFLAAGQCKARFAGLIAAGLAIVLYYQGVTMDDVMTFIGHFTERLGAASDAFLTAEVS